MKLKQIKPIEIKKAAVFSINVAPYKSKAVNVQ